MAYERSKLLSSPDGAAVNIPSVGRSIAIPVQRGAESGVAIDAATAAEELEHLRSVNERLRRELAALQLREAEALRLADRDGLTGLYNRRRMLELLKASIAEAGLHNLHVGLLFIDLNGFKAVNDFYGHAAGDRILNTVATRVSSRVRTGDIVCRYGGDEFVVVLPSLPEERCLAPIAEAVAERIALPYWLKGREQHLTASVGEAIYPRDGADAETLLHRADQNMYRVKNGTAGRARSSPPEIGTLQRLCRRRNDRS